MGVLIYQPYHDQQTLSQFRESLRADNRHKELMKFMKSQAVGSSASYNRYMDVMHSELENTRNQIAQSQKAMQDTIDKNTWDLIDDMEKNTMDIVASMEKNTLDIVASNEAIDRTLNLGFENLDNSLHDIHSSIDSLAADFRIGISELIEQQRITNLLNENIAELLKIPDSEKERFNYLENGLKHYKNGLFEDSLSNLLYVEKIRKEKVGKEDNYFVLYNIGLIYLLNYELFDSEKSAKYFEQAAKYAEAESYEESAKLANILEGKQAEERLSENIKSAGEMKKIASESYYYAAFALYLLGRFDKSIAYCKKAVELNPNFLEAQFQEAKSLSANNNPEIAAEVLEPVIRKEPEYSIKTSVDGDLFPKNEIKGLLLKLTTEYVNKAKNLLNKLKIDKENIDNKFQIDNHQYTHPLKKQIEEVQDIINRNTYIDSVEAIQKIKSIKQQEIIEDYRNFKKNLFNLENDIECVKKEHQNWWYNNSEEKNKTKNSMLEISKLFENGKKEAFVLMDNFKFWLAELLNFYGKGHTSCVDSVCFSPDGRYIVSGSRDKTIKLWDSKTGKEVPDFYGKGHTSCVDSVCFSPDGRYIVSGSLDKTIKLWDSKTGKEVPDFYGKGHTGYLKSVCFSPDGRYIVSGSSDKTIKLWDSKTGKEVPDFYGKGHTDDVNSVCFSPDGRYIVSGSRDKTIKLWYANFNIKSFSNMLIEKRKRKTKERLEKERLEKIKKERIEKEKLERQKQYRLQNNLCLECGKKLSLWDKISGKEICKSCRN